VSATEQTSIPDSDFIRTDIDAYLASHERKSLMRFITCGSVDDGKSTLIGRLLFDCKMIFDDQLTALREDSKRIGTQGESLDFALLVDGLNAEREQGITIDVAYRFFSTDKRKFIVADTPGHEQYTRNMCTGASTADLAVILVDARKGVLPQTRRHSYLCKLIGIRRFVLAVNKMDLVDYSREKYEEITHDYATLAQNLQIEDFVSIPISGFRGDNVKERSVNTAWFDGPTLLSHLESVEIDVTLDQSNPFRMSVQCVSRPNLDFRGFCGLMSSGILRRGDNVRILPSGKMSSVSRILTPDGEADRALAGQSVTVTFSDPVDCSRGDVIAAAEGPPQIADQFQVTIIWMVEEDLLPGRSYWLKLGTQTVSASLQTIRYEVNINTLAHLAADTLKLNSIGVGNLSTDRPLVFEPYERSRALGGFILIDKATYATVGAGVIHFALRRSDNIHPQLTDVKREERAQLKNQKPAVIWLTGLSGAGKSTIANLVDGKLRRMNRHTFLLDGDNVRHGLNRDLGFTDADRVENIRRVGEVARLMTDAGLIVIAAFISPFRTDRDMVRRMMAFGEFMEVYVDTSLSVAEARDVKGLYKKARAGALKNFTGIDSPYEAPENPEIRVSTTDLTAAEAADAIVSRLLADDH
jgi:bifunctional enzyme CysN/CysC